MNPRREAYERLGRRYELRVLEPSPPAVSRPRGTPTIARCAESYRLGFFGRRLAALTE